MENKLKIIKQFLFRVIKNHNIKYDCPIMEVSGQYANLYSAYTYSENNTKEIIFSCLCEYIVILLHNKFSHEDEIIFYKKLIERHGFINKDKITLITNLLKKIVFMRGYTENICELNPYCIFDTIIRIIDYAIWWEDDYDKWENYNEIVREHFRYNFLMI